MNTIRGSILFFLMISATAQATVFLSVDAVDGAAEIHLTIHNGSEYYGEYLDEIPAAYTHLAVLRSAHGLCDSETTISTEPIPIPPLGTSASFDLTDTMAEPERFYLYKAVGVEADGTLNDSGLGYGHYTNQSYASDGPGVVFRGFLNFNWDFENFPWSVCPCWSYCSGFDLGGVITPEIQALIDASTPMEVVAESMSYGEMPPDNFRCRDVLEVRPISECSTVGSVETTWGSLKQRYR